MVLNITVSISVFKKLQSNSQKIKITNDFLFQKPTLDSCHNHEFQLQQHLGNSYNKNFVNLNPVMIQRTSMTICSF